MTNIAVTIHRLYQSLAAHQPDPHDRDPSKLIPSHAIQRLVEALALERVQLELHPWQRRSVHRKIFRGDLSKLPTREVKPGRFKPLTTSNHHIVTLSSTAAGAHPSFAGHFGQMRLFKGKFEADDYVVADLFGSMLTDRLQLCLTRSIRISCTSATATIKYFLWHAANASGRDHDFVFNEVPRVDLPLFEVARDAPPGTVVQRLLHTLHNAIRPFAAYFITIDGERAYVEYHHRSAGASKWGQWASPALLTEEFRAACRKKLFFWLREHPSSPLGEALAKATDDIPAEPLLVVAPVTMSGQPIAAWVLALDTARPCFPEEYQGLLCQVAESSTKNSSFLFQRRVRKMIVQPNFNSRETRIDPKLIFTLMPFGEIWSDDIWQQVIRPAVDGLDLRAVRADDLTGQDILEDIWRGILASRLIIADTTGRNPNVFYELGIAHTLGKRVILLAQEGQAIPFDLSRYRHIMYKYSVSGCATLKRELTKFVGEAISESPPC